METLTKPVELNQETVQTLDEIRTGAENPLYGAAPAAAEELFKRHIQPLLEGSGMPGLLVMHYGWFLRELARLWRTRTGRDLAFHLELCIRKWLNLGLESNTVQFLVTEIYLRLKTQAASPTLDCGSVATAFPVGSSASGNKAAAVLPHSKELRSPSQSAIQNPEPKTQNPKPEVPHDAQ